jgi:hypothetical protein
MSADERPPRHADTLAALPCRDTSSDAVTAVVGARYRLKEHVGYQPDLDPDRMVEGIAIEQLVDRHHPLFAGQEFTLVEIVPADVDGAGSYEEDHLVLETTHHQLLNHEAGKTEPEHRDTGLRRRWSCTEAQLDELFEPVSVS